MLNLFFRSLFAQDAPLFSGLFAGRIGRAPIFSVQIYCKYFNLLRVCEKNNTKSAAIGRN